jgi:CubicO group peptidase (beta-lactamase class C family)
MRLLRLALPLLALGIALLAHPHKPQSTHLPVPTQQQIPPALPTVAHILDTADLQTFFDGIVPMQLQRSDIAGASVLVMKDDQVLLKKGYGYADIQAKTPVDSDTTIFQLGSVSKLFTWISVMQLQEQGKLDTDVDVNRYLDFQIKPAFAKRITLRNLMTHQAGFEYLGNDVLLLGANHPLPLRDFLVKFQPRRIFPPGTVPAYSNYGTGLAGYVVQRVSGEPFEQYVQEHIFAPLGMTHSTFVQPLPPDLAPLRSLGYAGNTQSAPLGFEVFNPPPAGGVSSTAADMGRFASALLHGGELNGQRILKPETLAAMWKPQFRASEQLPPLGMGFFEKWRNGLRWIGHDGGLIAFHSFFFLEPQQHLALFVVYNSAGAAGQSRDELFDLFSDRYFPSHQQPTFLNPPANYLQLVAGTYQSTRRPESTPLKLQTLFHQRDANVSQDGTLRVDGYQDLRGHAIEWKPIATDLWQSANDQARLFAIRNDHGEIIRLADDTPDTQQQRVPWYENHHTVFPALGVTLAILAMVLLASLSRLCQRLVPGRGRSGRQQSGTLRLSWPTRVAAFLWVALIATVYYFLIAKAPLPPTDAWDKYFYAMNVATACALLFSLFVLFSAIQTFARGDLALITRLKFSVIAGACVFLSWFALHWHLIG